MNINSYKLTASPLSLACFDMSDVVAAITMPCFTHAKHLHSRSNDITDHIIALSVGVFYPF